MLLPLFQLTTAVAVIDPLAVSTHFKLAKTPLGNSIRMAIPL